RDRPTPFHDADLLNTDAVTRGIWKKPRHSNSFRLSRRGTPNEGAGRSDAGMGRRGHRRLNDLLLASAAPLCWAAFAAALLRTVLKAPSTSAAMLLHSW